MWMKCLSVACDTDRVVQMIVLYILQESGSTQANGTDFLTMNLSAKEMRERLAQKKKVDPKQKANMDFKSKYEIFQKM